MELEYDERRGSPFTVEADWCVYLLKRICRRYEANIGSFRCLRERVWEESYGGRVPQGGGRWEVRGESEEAQSGRRCGGRTD